MNANDWLERLHCPSKRPFEELGNIGLAILCRPQTPEAEEIRHLGIVYRTPRYGANTIHLLHVPSHMGSVRGRLRNDYGWLEPILPRPLARLLVAQCVRIMERYEYQGLPYGLRYAYAQFDVNGEYKPNGDKGLTCATFVLAVFASAGLELLRREEWFLRIDDRRDKKRLIRGVRDGGAQQHAAVLESEDEMAAPRFRPEEVVAAGTVDGSALPLGFREAEARGAAIVAELLRRAHG